MYGKFGNVDCSMLSVVYGQTMVGLLESVGTGHDMKHWLRLQLVINYCSWTRVKDRKYRPCKTKVMRNLMYEVIGPPEVTSLGDAILDSKNTADGVTSCDLHHYF